ncbi:MAG TPA: prolipoprotein diacylglyceryl transferase family protein [Acidimicrobiia bacterium]|nr:prolipoprotein diacylglyceryl transferase family protein [Acidimicrobiia bacterium]
MLAEISYPPIPIFDVGPLRLSLHGLMAGVGFVVGASLMIREARRRGFDEDKITSVLTWALVGSLIGARYFTSPAHLDEGLAEALKPFGTFSIMGGFAGGIIVGWWRMRRLGLDVAAHMDMASFGLAIGTVVGRIGDLLIVEHLGGRTNAFFGYGVKPGYDLAPQHNALECATTARADGLCAVPGSPDLAGVYHHVALYDLIGAALLLGLLYLLARRWTQIRYSTLILVWGAWYGLQRFVLDFMRNTDLPGADATAGPFTWNQWTGLVAGVIALGLAAWVTVRRRTPVVSAADDVARGARPRSEAAAG